MGVCLCVFVCMPRYHNKFFIIINCSTDLTKNKLQISHKEALFSVSFPFGRNCSPPHILPWSFPPPPLVTTSLRRSVSESADDDDHPYRTRTREPRYLGQAHSPARFHSFPTPTSPPPVRNYDFQLLFSFFASFSFISTDPERSSAFYDHHHSATNNKNVRLLPNQPPPT